MVCSQSLPHILITCISRQLASLCPYSQDDCMNAIVSLPGVDVATNPRAPSIARIVEPEEIQSKTGAWCCLLNSCTIGVCNTDCATQRQISCSTEVCRHL